VKERLAAQKITETMSIRMDRGNYESLSEMIEMEKSDLSKVVRALVTRGRLLLAIEKYRSGEASLGRVIRTDDDDLDRVWRREPDRERRLSARTAKPFASSVSPVVQQKRIMEWRNSA
jgi:hypothetical protein